MKKHVHLQVIGLILLIIGLYYLADTLGTAFEENANYAVVAIKGTIFWVAMIAGLEITSVGFGIYQNQYTGSRLFKGILY